MKSIESLMKIYNTNRVRRHYCTLYFEYNINDLSKQIKDVIYSTVIKHNISNTEIEGGIFTEEISSFSVTLELYTLTDNMENIKKHIDKIGNELYNKLKKDFSTITLMGSDIYDDVYTEYLTLQDILLEPEDIQKEIIRSLNKEYRLR